MRFTLLAAAVFAIAYTQAPLYFLNQNQYLLHGEAQTRGSYLASDWLANTQDPTPLFSAFVKWTEFEFPSLPITVAYALVMVAYVVSVIAIVRKLPRQPATRVGRGFAFALFLAAHAALFRWLSVQLTGVDYPWYFQAGVAGQYVLGPGLQPSVFGVFLVSSVAAFLHDRRAWAVAFAVFACAMHFTYLLPTAALFLGYLVADRRAGKGSWKFAVGMALGVLPVVIFNAVRFQPTDVETLTEAQRLLVEVRIPHHCLIQKWLDPVAGLQVAWVAWAVWLVRRNPLAVVLAAALGVAVVLTAVAAVSGWYLLMLLFPWRVSAVLVPIATAVIVSRFVSWVETRRRSRPTMRAVGSAIVCACLTAGIAFPLLRIGYPMNEAVEGPLLTYVGRMKHRGDVYLIPTKIPALSGGRRGSFSMNFAPPPRPTNGNLIPVDLQRFRLAAGAPIFVDFKAIPYADREVLEWYRRVRLAERWYAERKWDAAELRAEGITHVVMPANQPIDSPAFREEYADESFRVYKIVD